MVDNAVVCECVNGWVNFEQYFKALRGHWLEKRCINAGYLQLPFRMLLLVFGMLYVLALNVGTNDMLYILALKY